MRAARTSPWLDRLLLATVMTSTWSKLYWQPAGRVPISTILAIAFVGAFVGHRTARREGTLPRGIAVLIGWLIAFAVVDLAGFGNIDTATGQSLFARGFATWGIHAALLATAALHVAEAGRPLTHRCALAFVTGATINATYGVLQLLALGIGGTNLDAVLFAPLGLAADGARGIQFFGAGIYRINGLMRDTNHFGVMLAAALPLAIALLRGTRRWWTVGLLGAALALSLSRSGAVGLLAALTVLAWPQRARLLRNRQLLAATTILVVTIVAFTQVFPSLTQAIVTSRLNTDTGSTQTHIELYRLVPQMLAPHPLLGIGFNTYSLSFEQISGRPEFGPHSLYVRLAVETGVFGTLAFAGFAAQLVRTLLAAAAREPARLGLLAAVVGTWAGNAFYLTTQIIYVDVLYALAFALPYVVGAQSAPRGRGRPPMDDALQSTAHGGSHGRTLQT